MEPRLTILDRVRATRDRLIANPRFRAWAASNPVTRPIARKRTRALFDLCAGFVYSQVLHACIELGLFGKLAAGPATLAQLAPALNLAPERAERLLDAAIALQLVSRRSRGRYGLGPLGAALVGNDAITAMVAHHTMLYADLADPVSLLRAPPGETQLSRYWNYAADGKGSEKHAYTALMAASQALVAGEILDAYDVRNHRCLMDVGGGDGTFLRHAATRAPSLKLVLFDLPSVAVQARARFAEAGISARSTAIGGSFLADELPKDADLISLVRVIHDHDDGQAMQALRAVYAALPPGGRLLLAEPMAETPGAEPVGDAYFGFYLLAMGRGRPRSAARLQSMLQQAGFSRTRQLRTRTPALVSVITAVRAA